ncbi:MAG TPA: MFS transporter [Polyangiaceae bacterium]|nr:MFS transporter [Polyangiaceae bacterium]
MRVTRNPALLCVYQALFGTIFPVAIFPLFWVDDLHMSISTMLSVQAFFGFVIAVFEFPSGYIADRVGHRFALVSGSALALLGWSLYAVAGSLRGVIAAEAVLGIGFSLISGADSALLYESLAQTGQEPAFARWYARARMCGQIAEGSAALVAGWLYAYASRLPFQLEIIVWSFALIVALGLAPVALPAPKIQRHFDQMRFIARHGLRESKPLRAVVFASVAFGLMSFLPVWLIALYARDAGMQPAWLGPFWASANYVIAFGSLVSERAGRRLGLGATLWLGVAIAAAGYAGLGLGHGVYAAFFYYLLTFVRGLHAPLLHHEEQRLVPSSDRAGFLSFRNFLFRGCYVLLGPWIGAAVERYGQRAVLLGCGACVVLALIAATRAIAAQTRARDELASSPAQP